MKKKLVSTSSNSIANITNNSANQNKVSLGLTVMLIMESFLYTIGNMPYIIYFTIRQIYPTYLDEPFLMFYRVCLAALIALKPVIYLIFNKIYRQQFIKIFLNCACLKINLAGLLLNSSDLSASNSQARSQLTKTSNAIHKIKT